MVIFLERQRLDACVWAPPRAPPPAEIDSFRTVTSEIMDYIKNTKNTQKKHNNYKKVIKKL
jgi:hypothetical protein